MGALDTPWALLFILSVAVLGWSFWRSKMREPKRPHPVEDEAERIYRLKRAEADAEDRIRSERAAQLLVGGIGSRFPNVFEEIEATRKHEVELRRIAELRDAATPPPPPPPPKFDMPLKAVLERIAFESEWSVSRDWRSPRDHWQETMWEKPLAKELLRPLASGDIPSRGIKSTSEGDEHGHSHIPDDFWRNAKLTVEADRLLLEPGFDFVMMFGEECAYHDIRLRRADVDQQWPARRAEDIEARPSPFVGWAEERKAVVEEREINSQMEYEEMRARAAAAARAAYYEDRPQLTIQEAACFVADVSPLAFEQSDKAQSIAKQLIYYATTGAMPIATEPDAVRAARKAAVTMGGIEVPEVTLNTFVTREALEHYRDKALRTWMQVQDPATRRE